MANGNRAPVRVIEGQETRMGRSIHGIAYDAVHDEIIVPNPMASAILVFRGGANGDEAPIRIIQGPKTRLAYPHAVSFDEQNNEILVADVAARAVLVFSRDTSGDVSPLRVIQGPKTKLGSVSGVVIDSVHDLLVVTSTSRPASVQTGLFIFNRTDNGDAAPQRVIAGSQTGMIEKPRQIQIYEGKIFVAAGNYSAQPPYKLDKPRPGLKPGAENVSSWTSDRVGFIGVWDVTDSGNVPPRAVIKGPESGVIHSGGLALNPRDREIYVTDSVKNGLFTFSVPEFFGGRNDRSTLLPKE
jgi:hypothetical protein